MALWSGLWVIKMFFMFNIKVKPENPIDSVKSNIFEQYKLPLG